MDQSLQTSLVAKSDSSTSNSRWVKLSQPVESGMDKTASMFDIAQMIARASAGESAFTYKKNNCPAGLTDTGVTVRLDFEAWPSLLAPFTYTLSSNIGEIFPAVVIDEYTEFSVVFEMSDHVDLGFILASISSIKWETDCYDENWQPLAEKPDITMDGLTTLKADQPIFAVVRVLGTKIGARHRVTAQLIKAYPVRPDAPIPEEGITADDLDAYWAYTDIYTWNGTPLDETDTIDMTGLSLDNLSITITAKWMNADGEEESVQMPLTIPQCVTDLLSVCDGDLESFNGGIFSSGTRICGDEDNDDHLTVYTSGCTGKVLDERKTKDDPDSWCE